MDEIFDTPLPDGQRTDIQICIFPHLKEFLTVDLREDGVQVNLLNTDDIFSDRFFKSVEEEISISVKDQGDYPFSHLINLPMMLEEAVRETAMTYILDHMGVHLDDEEEFPTVVVYIISGGALAMHSDKVLEGLQSLLKDRSGNSVAGNWEHVLNRLIGEENRILQELARQDLTEAVHSQTVGNPLFFT